jgi:hypothetical protein
MEDVMASMNAAHKPPYLGLLNAIALAESRAGVYLTAWADATPDEDLACTLRLVAARETSHAELFTRRLCELGFGVLPKADPGSSRRLAKLADPRISDLEKVGEEREEVDTFGDIERQLADGVFDDMTCNMLTWYINEERDSGRRLRDAYDAVRAKARGGKKANGHAKEMSAGPSADAEAIMACMAAGFAKLEKTLEKVARASQ